MNLRAELPQETLASEDLLSRSARADHRPAPRPGPFVTL